MRNGWKWAAVAALLVLALVVGGWTWDEWNVW